MLLPVAHRIVDAVRIAGLAGIDLFGGYVVLWDEEKDKHTLSKQDQAGIVLFSLTEETNLYHLEIFAEDVMNNLVPGVSHFLAESSAKGQQVYNELQNMLGS